MSSPLPSKYKTRDGQQAAYRQRRIVSEKELLSQKGLPAFPTIPTLPSHAAWSAMIAPTHRLLSEAVVEMQTYHDDRSSEWQESVKAEELLGKVEQLQETREQLQGED